MNTSFWLVITTNITCEGMLNCLISKLLKNKWEEELSSDRLTLNLLKFLWPLKLDSDCLIAKFLKTPWLDWMIFNSARLNSISILIFFHVKKNWLKLHITVFVYLCSLLRLFNSSFLNIWDILNFPFFLFLLFEMPSLNRNEKVAWL